VLPNWLTTLIKAIFSVPAAGIMLTAALGILAVVLAAPAGLGPKAKIACYLIGIVAAICIVLYVWSVFQNVRIRERLSEYLSQGTNLLDECVKRTQRSKPPPTDETNSWIEETTQYIKDGLDRADYLRFRDAPPSATTPFVGDRMPEQQWREYRRIFARLEVLKKLIEERSKG
jgi:hypothetical protein